MNTFSRFFDGTVEAHADSVAIIDTAAGRSYTFSEFDTLVHTFVADLAALALPPSSHVALAARNSVAWVAMEAALALSGHVCVPINVFASGADAAAVLNHARARAVVTDSHLLAAMEDACERLDDDLLLLRLPEGNLETTAHLDTVAAPTTHVAGTEVDGSTGQRLMYTSGTSGQPKGIVVTAGIFVAAVESCLENQLSGLGEGARLLVTTPLTHVANGYFWSFFAAGRPSVLAAHYRPAGFVDLVEQYAITHTIMGPTLIADLLTHLQGLVESAEVGAPSPTSRLGSLAAIWYAGSPIPRSVALRAERLLGPICNQQYGFTEMLGAVGSTAATMLRAEDHADKPGSCGRAVTGLEVRVLDDAGGEVPVGESGEVALRTADGVVRRWLGEEGQVDEPCDWLYSGDLGRIDDAGYFFLTDRKSDMIVSGGLNIFPHEVEQCIDRFPGVDQCAVVGGPHPRWVEAPQAFITVLPGHDVDPGALIAFCRENLSHYKAPIAVHVEGHLPLGPTGKVLRKELRKRIADPA